MERLLYFAVPLILSASLFAFLSYKYAWSETLWNRLLSKVHGWGIRMIIWLIAAVVLQVAVQTLFEHIGISEPQVRIPVGFVLGMCSPFIPLYLKE